MRFYSFVLSIVCLLFVQSCSHIDQVQVYTVQKSSYGQEIKHVLSETRDSTSVKWSVPSHWVTLQHNSLSKARYKIGDDCYLSITAFPGLAGGLLNNINRWRQQLMLTPIKITELSDYCDTLKTSNFTFTLVLLDGSAVNTNRDNYLFSGIFYYEKETWWYT